MKKLLFNPFDFFSGKASLVIGIGIISLTAVICSFGNIHLDGIVDLHAGTETNIGIAFTESFIDLISIAFFIYLAGLIFPGASVSPINVLGTQALARFPILISSVCILFLFSDRVPAYMLWKFQHEGKPVEINNTDIVLFMILSLFLLVLLVWSLLLMYKAYSKSCNVKGVKAIVSFIAIVIVSEIPCKFLLARFVY